MRMQLVMDTGNPWIFLGVSLPVPVYTRTHDVWVRINTGFRTGTDRGMLPLGMGKDFAKNYLLD